MTMAIFFLSASLITASSMMEPPVWMMALTPALAAIVTVSGMGKNASDIKTLPRADVPARRMAWIAESTRLVWPQPIPMVCVPLIRTMALLLTCLISFQPKIMASICDLVGLILLTIFIY